MSDHTRPYMSAYPYSQQANQSINPALLAFQRSAPAINPALLQSNVSINPAQLVNSVNPQNLMNPNISMNSIGTVNPAVMMNGVMNGATPAMPSMQGLSPNPAMIQQLQQLSNMSPQDISIAQAKFLAQRQAQQSSSGPGASLNMSQFPGQQTASQPQQQQQHSPSSYYPSSMPPPQQIPPRPPTAMSMAMSQSQPMQPPPRPPTAASSRPGTAAGLQTHQGMPGPSNNGFSSGSAQQQISRPPSRPQTAGSNHGGAGFGMPQQQQQGSPGAGGFGGVAMNGFGQQHQHQHQQGYAQPQQRAQQRSPTPSNGSMHHQGPQQLNHGQGQHPSQNAMGSPYPGGKRKLPGGETSTSPQLGQAPRMPSAGPPGQMGLNIGIGGLKQPGQVGMNVGMGAMGMGGPSNVNMGSIGAMGAAGLGIGGMGGIGMFSAPGAGGGMMAPPAMSRQMSADPQSQQHPALGHTQTNHTQQQHGMVPGFPPLNAIGAQQPQQQQQLLPQRGTSHEPPGHGHQAQGGMPMSMSMPMMNGMATGPGDTLSGSGAMMSEQARMAAMAGLGNGMNVGVGLGNPMIPSAAMPGGPHTQQQPQMGGQQHHHQLARSPSSAQMGMSMAPGMNVAGLGGMGMGMGGLTPMQIQHLQERKTMSTMAALQQQQQQQQQQHQQKVQTPNRAGARSTAPSAGGLLAAPSPHGTPTRPGTASSSTGVGMASTSRAPSQPPPQSGALALLPPGMNLSAAVTRVTAVPLAQVGTLIPPLDDGEVDAVRGWMARDHEYEGVYRAVRERMRGELATAVGTARRWWERDTKPEGLADVEAAAEKKRKEPFNIVYPRSAREIAARDRRKPGRRDGFKLPPRVKPTDASRADQLVPIRLEFDVEHHRYRDTFVWNLNDPFITPEVFAQSVVEDYGLVPNFHSVITKSIQEQLSDYKAHCGMFTDGDDIRTEPDVGSLKTGALEGDDFLWWESWRKRLRSKRGFVKWKSLGLGNDAGAARVKKRRKTLPDEVTKEPDRGHAHDPIDVEAAEDSAHEEMRILIKLDITVGAMKLDDQFEWDLENDDTTPEQFADAYGNDLGLVGEFKTAIAHSIREQVQTYQKSLFLVGHPSDGSMVQDEDLRMSFLPSVTSVARAVEQTPAFTPILNYLSDGELERIDKEREKELNKRRKRNTRGRRGITLPDREPLKTHRTPAIGFPPIDPSTLALTATPSAPTSRRAAAAAASVNIANMVASENGTAIIPQTAPVLSQIPTLSVSKIPKAKGSFKPPSYPPAVLKARARVTAPTPSTSVDASTFEPPLEGDLPLPPSASVVAPPDAKASKIISARRQRELEKEAKEKEFADGQHANMIDGIWHCSNCGCPDSVAIGRRKGPLGDKSQCGACGKFWHRHRRPRPVEYHADAEYHINVKLEAERAKAPVKKRGAAAQRALNTSQQEQTPPPSANQPASADHDSPPTLPKHEVWVELKSPRKTRSSSSFDLVEPIERPLSPASSVSSSASERPLAQTVLQTNGLNHKPPSSTNPSRIGPPNNTESLPQSERPSPIPVAPPDVSPSGGVHVTATLTLSSAPDSTPVVSTPPVSQPRPQWLEDAMAEMQARYPDDKFDVIMRKVNPATTHEWRVKCLDCPGKLYTPGPGETLNNYEVHLKNRQHRARVHTRVNGTS